MKNKKEIIKKLDKIENLLNGLDISALDKMEIVTELDAITELI